MFVTTKVREGLLPRILRCLLAARKSVKEAMKGVKDPFKKAVLDRRQNALKLKANSGYGFTGVTAAGGLLPFLPISRSTTGSGRKYIELAAKTAEELANEAPSGKTEVVYGDTDSIMVNGDFKDFHEAHAWSLKAVNAINSKTPEAVKIVWEKIYIGFLLMSKKRYAGVLYTKAEKYDKIDAKGMETARRDNCLYATNIIKNSLNTLLFDGDIRKAVREAQAEVDKLDRGELDMHMLRISKGLQKRMLTPEDQYELEEKRNAAEDEEALMAVEEQKSKRFYATMQPHAVLHRKMEKRDSTTAPHVGDRVWYVIVKEAKGTAVSLRAEDPLYGYILFIS